MTSKYDDIMRDYEDAVRELEEATVTPHQVDPRPSFEKQGLGLLRRLYGEVLWPHGVHVDHDETKS